jgi:hypothetical protein
VSYLCIFFLACSAGLIFPDSARGEKGAGQKTCPSGQEGQWGIKILNLRLTAAGHMLDLRFRVLDPDKAVEILSRNNEAYIVDQESGKALPVPVTKAGALRQTTLNPQAGRVYFILFSNTGGLVKEGSIVTLAIGDVRIKNIAIQTSGAEGKGEELLAMDESKLKEWKAIRERLRKEYAVCIEHCGKDKTCIHNCSQAHAARKQSDYFRLLHQEYINACK